MFPADSAIRSNEREVGKRSSYINIGVKNVIASIATCVLAQIEWTGKAPLGHRKGRERIVIGSDGRSYYTNDHYMTFALIK